jgi:hypothetical protein
MRKHQTPLSLEALNSLHSKIKNSSLTQEEKEDILNELMEAVSKFDLEDENTCDDFVVLYSVLSKVA